MDRGVLLSSTINVDADQLQFAVRSHPDSPEPFVVLQLGRYEMSMHVFDPATLTALAQTVAEAHDLLTAALAGQDRLPIETLGLVETGVSA